MENSNNSNENCNCSDGCCQTKKRNNLWTKILFIVIVVAAISIISVKLTSKNCNTQPNSATSNSVQNPKPSCCDTTKQINCTEGTNQSNKKPCCPRSK